jgi:hypothetical protein
MSSSFWSNTLWYILLLITSLISFIAAIVKSKNRRFTVAFTLATLGLVYIIEANLVVILNAYSYYPKIIPDSFLDTVFGNYFSQLSISSTSALAIEYGLSFKWYFLFAIIYYFIEALFLKLGIYQHHWYKSVYTLVGFIGLLWLIKAWNRMIINSSKFFIHLITLFLAVYGITSHTILNFLHLSGIIIFSGKFYTNPSKDNVATGIIYIFFLINILIILYILRLNWAWKGIVFTILFFAHSILYGKGIIIYREGWFLITCLYTLFSTYFLIYVFDYWLKYKPLKIES